MIRFVTICLILSLAIPVEATVLYFSGFETGSVVEHVNGIACAGCGPQSTTVHTGKYAWQNVNVGNSTHMQNMSTTTASARVYAYFTSYSTTSAKPVIQFGAAGSTIVMEVQLQLASPGTLAIGASTGFTAANGSTVVTLNRWHRIDLALDSAAGGIGRIWLNGNLEIDTTHTGATGPITTFRTNNVLSGTSAYFDDILIQDGTARPPDGRSIVRQGLSTTPTDNAWTKSTGSTIDTVWNQTPFGTTLNANSGSTTGSNAQTMFTQSVTVENGTYGPGHISSTDTVNACKVGVIGNTSNVGSGGTAGSVRRRLSGVATDTSYFNFSTTTRWQESAYFTDTLSNINLLEFGAVKAVTGVALTHTIYAAYLMCDFIEPAKLQIKTADSKLFTITGGSGKLQTK
jgi:hypothetical protein